MNVQIDNSISRDVVLLTLKEYSIPTPRPAHMMKTAELIELLPLPKSSNTEDAEFVEIQRVESKAENSTPSVKDQIIEFHKMGFTGSQIKKQMPTTHPSYIYTVLSKYKRSLK